MGENLDFVRNTISHSIPWYSLSGPYGRADEVPNWIAAIHAGGDLDAETAARGLSMNVEHQGTLWSLTPFALLCLRNELDQALRRMGEDPEAPHTARRILDVYHPVFCTAADGEPEHPEPLPRFADLILPQNLLGRGTVDEYGWDNEKDLLEEYYATLDERLYYSFHHYAWSVLGLSIAEDFPRLRALGNPVLDGALDRFSGPRALAFLDKLARALTGERSATGGCE